MKSYGQFCPVAKAAEVFCERWTPLILRDLSSGHSRFSELQRGIPLASPTLLSRRLKQLEAEGIIVRQRSRGGRSWTYHLTDAGKEFAPLVLALGEWGQRWSRRKLADNEVDLGLLLWAVEQGAKPDAFGDRRTIVQLELVDQPDGRRHWWFLNEKGKCELCLEAPVQDADLYVAATLVDMIYIWRGDLPLASALSSGRLEAHGATSLCRAFPRWLGTASVAHIKSRRDDAVVSSEA
jgi:DNA-binding HxlR family transcriptional regulator